MKFQKTKSSIVGLQANSQPAAANINIKAVNFQPISNVCHDQTTKMFNWQQKLVVYSLNKQKAAGEDCGCLEVSVFSEKQTCDIPLMFASVEINIKSFTLL